MCGQPRWQGSIPAVRSGLPATKESPMTAPSDPHPRVVVGFDGSPASHVALTRAIERVGAYGKLYLVHAWEVPEAWRGRGTYQPYVDRALTRAEEAMESAVAA